MPLIILGLLLILGIIFYSLFRYMNSPDADTRTVRERYPHAFKDRAQDKHETRTSDNHEGHSGDASEHKDHNYDDPDEPVEAAGYVDEDSLRGDVDYMIRNITEKLRDKTKDINLDLDSIRRRFGHDENDDEDEPDNTVEFPKDNIETEKRKRGIH